MDRAIQRVSGSDYLELVTSLLQRARLEHPTQGLWEAADFQWWWRRGRSSDSIQQIFWVDEMDRPVAAVILTHWDRAWGCDLIVGSSKAKELVPTLWSHALGRIHDLAIDKVEMMVRDDHFSLIDLATAAGFASTEERLATAWIDSVRRAAVTSLPDGYRLNNRIEAANRPHHMIPRSGADVAERLAQTSLYRPDLDLFIETTTGELAGYGLFWFDPVTRVGLVEPMRTETDHQRRGLARHLLLSGLERLAALGAVRLKVNYEIGSRGAERLYLGAGFLPESTSTIYVRRKV